MNPGSNVGQDLVRVLVSVSESLHVKLPQPSISKHVAVTHGLGIVIGIRNVLTEEISDIAGYRPIVGLGRVGQKDLHISATHPDDDVKLVIDGHHTDSPSITGQTPQLGDELIEVISEHRFHRNCDALTVIVVEGYYKVDLILAGVLEIVVIVIIVVIVVPVIAVVVVIRQLVVIVEIIVVIDVIVGTNSLSLNRDMTTSLGRRTSPSLQTFRRGNSRKADLPATFSGSTTLPYPAPLSVPANT